MKSEALTNGRKDMKKTFILTMCAFFILCLLSPFAFAKFNKLTLTASASAEYSGPTLDRTASRVADGEYSTFWMTDFGEIPCWIMVDAGSVRTIDHIMLMWYNSMYAPSDYDLEISDDAITWEKLEEHAAGVYTGTGEMKEIKRDTRYIRLYIHQAPYLGVMREFEAYVESTMPRIIRFQGLLGDAGGGILEGTYTVTFRLYDTEAGGMPLWSEVQNNVEVSEGVLDIEIGSITPIDLSFEAQYWLGVEVGTDGEMSPRFKLTSVPYAFTSEE